MITFTALTNVRKRLAEIEADRPMTLREAVKAVLDDILAARKRGVTWDDLVKALAADGIATTAQTLRVYVTALVRERDDGR